MKFTPDRWRTLSPFLDQALELSTIERAEWLAAVSARDASLAVDLHALLSEHDVVRESGFLEQPVSVAHGGRTPSLQGEIVGTYKLVSLIDQGGMGSVWLAERCDGRFEGHAAVKLLNHALIGRAGEERFQREGHILARLTHPSIARLIDAGVAAGNQPYLILEYVDGQNIDRYCDERALGLHPRVRLFLDVLEAVAHAHTSLIVHRDLKPANVLVSVDGRVKLLDFGIAKLLETDSNWDDGHPPAALTREGGAALTPQYAAPEQLAGGSITTATDVYALGVLLYVLLSGRHPAGTALQSPATLMRAIVDTDPMRMSDAVAGDAATSRLRRMLRGDLDTIVAKALKKNPAERYASVTAFADDLRRVLRHEPISARPDTLVYRTARFVQRHTQGVATAAAVVVLLSGSIAFYTARLAAERDRARREAAKATTAKDLMIGLLTRVDPIANVATEEGPTVRGLLDSGSEQAEKQLAAEPELQADVLAVLGRIYRKIGVFDKAQRLLEQSLVSGRAVYGPEHVRVAQTLNDLGALLTDKGDYAAAGRTLEDALRMRRKLLGAEHADVAVTLVELGRVYQDQGFNDRADPLLREALAIRTKVLGPDHPETAVSVNAMASVLRLNGDLSGAERLLRQGLELNRRTRGEFHANTGTSLHDLGVVAASRGDYALAESLFRQALVTHRKALGDAHPVVATSLNGLSRALVGQRRYDEAAASLREALAVARPALGSDHQLVAIYTINLGALELRRRQPAAAEPLIREGLRIRSAAPDLVPGRRRTFPEDDWSVGATKSLLGAALAALTRYPEAERVLLDARHDLEASPRSTSHDLTTAITRLADMYQAWGKRDKAATLRASLASL